MATSFLGNERLEKRPGQFADSITGCCGFEALPESRVCQGAAKKGLVQMFDALTLSIVPQINRLKSMPDPRVRKILDQTLAGERLSSSDCTTLLESYDVAAIGAAADEVRARRHPDNVVTYIIDRNINYTNVCNVVCTFCAFYRRPGAPDTYVQTMDQICEKIDETIALGGTGVLMQGGLHPDFGIEWYEDMLRTLSAKYPGFQLHCFSPPEIHNIHLITGLDYETIMQRLKDAGLYSLPGGGAEILDDEVRKRVATKCTTAEWLEVMRAVHKVGLRSSATMMFGIGDRIEHRVRHLQRIRDLQDETGGFFAFIPWTFQRENTALGRKIKTEPTGMDYLKMLSVSRLFMDNIDNIQSSWLTQGLRLGQVALRFGANDMGSIMIEENVVSAAGAHNRASEETLRYLISEAGFIPQQRDILYEPVSAERRSEMMKQVPAKRELNVMSVA
jgi:cyclic dehypoxanthinyl futalosine synthase